MKKITSIGLLILSCMILSCHPKKEKKQPKIYYNNQNYKLDDDEIIKRNTKDPKDKNHNLEKEKSDKVGFQK
ncbi:MULTISPECIES: hypothetical protein [unclassified Flavobacterium]|jgi:hypothetical protein|uniref:hypothetical protein n=1 Tax=unclassified Flavobacterium TaxID=196869 RepID=UPI0025C420C7|nr:MULTISPECIES: hypothetical protein [unclassified Flavobacterium]